MATSTAGPWVQRPPESRDGSGLRLFCFPYAGGSPAIFRTWPGRLSGEIDVCPVQLPGRGSRFRETPFQRLNDLIPAVADGLEPLLDRPYAFFGHSMGALVAFELARELRRRGRPGPVALLLSAHEAPHRPSPLPPFGHLPDTEFIDEMGRRYKGIPDEVLEEPELLELLMPVLRADINVLESYSYHPQSPLDCTLSCFGGSDDPHLTLEDLEAWRDHSRGEHHLRVLNGNHFFLETAQSDLLRAISEDLQPWLNGSSTR